VFSNFFYMLFIIIIFINQNYEPVRDPGCPPGPPTDFYLAAV